LQITASSQLSIGEAGGPAAVDMRRCYRVTTTASANSAETAFTSPEREYIRRELDQFFGTFPFVADSFQLRTWRGGLQKGHAKLPPPAKTLVERGLMRLDQAGRVPRLIFTEAGVAALRRMMADRRFTDPIKFAHVRRELGIEPLSDSKAAE